MLDWLAVLGLEIDEPIRYVAYRPLLRAMGAHDERFARVRARLTDWQLPFGGVYVILAHKKATAGIEAHETRRKFAKGPTLVPALPKPTARHTSG